LVIAEARLPAFLNAANSSVDADAELMLRFQAGEEVCFEALVQRYRKPLAGFIYRMVQDAAVSEELVQETFVRVYMARGRYRPDARFTTWLYRIAHHLSLNHLRDHRHERRTDSLDEPAGDSGQLRDLPSRAPGIEARLLQAERAATVRRAIAALPDRQRAAVIMHKYQDFDYRQIGEVLHLSASATKSLLFRAYEKLRHDLAPWLEESAGVSRGAS
jgi:RNA polymerase sigma-70 factor (ECF subfamily)